MPLLLDLLSTVQDEDTGIRYGEMAPHINARHLQWLAGTVRRRREEEELITLGGLNG